MNEPPTRIDEVYLKEVGPFEEVTIPFPPGSDPKLADVYLLTGPNGSGKSTVLYAIAGLVGCARFGGELIGKRFWSLDSLLTCRNGDATSGFAWGSTRGGERRYEIPDPGGRKALTSGFREFDERYHHFSSSTEFAEPLRFAHYATQFQMDSPNDRHPFSWAAFAYAGMRDIVDTKVTAITEPTFSPFQDCLSFIQTANAQRLAEWVANQDFKRLKAKEAGKQDRAAQLENSIRQIERIIAEITETDFAFVSSDETNNIRVRFDGRVVDLGLLPDGLKSIVSWIADLLMRMDRIPWENDVPVLERSFLLLLDEVDVHLHPAWQRKVLPIVQKAFPNAQIIASTHSPFVVASAEDAHIITLKVENGEASLEGVEGSQAGVSYSAVLRSIFGIDTEFDVETEALFAKFHEAKQSLLSGRPATLAEVEQLATDLAKRGEEVEQLVAIELRQLRRQLKPAVAS